MIKQITLYLLFIVTFGISYKFVKNFFRRDVEKYISKMVARNTPYEKNILNCTLIINNNNVYPPGKLTEAFLIFLLESNLIKNKIIADIGCGCFALGIFTVKNGAKLAVGTNINKFAISCAKDNVALHKVEDKTILLQGNEIEPLLPEFKDKFDLILAGAPWDTISKEKYDNIKQERQTISRAFYDVDDKLIISILTKLNCLLASKGRVFITSAMNKIHRLEILFVKYDIKYKIVKSIDIHNDGNIHYIIELIIKNIPKE